MYKKLIICFFLLFLISTIFPIFVKNNKTPITKKVAFVVHTETIGGKGIYEIYQEMKKVGHQIKIIALP